MEGQEQVRGLQFLDGDDDDTELFVWRMFVPDTDIRAFVVACSDTDAKLALVAEFGNPKLNWTVEDVAPFDRVPRVICLARGVQTQPVIMTRQ